MGLYSSCKVGVPPEAEGGIKDRGELALQERLWSR